MKKVRDEIDRVPLKELAEIYGTPLYLYSGSKLEERLDEWKREFGDRYENVRVSYASKAFACIPVYQLMESYGFGLDVVSGGEIYTAYQAGFPMEEAEFNGNNKTREELDLAAKYGVGRIIIDGPQEVPMLEETAEKYRRRWKVLLRVNPDVETATHRAISTGHLLSKFGLPLGDPLTEEILRDIKESSYLDFQGLQFHVGSQLFDNSSHLKALDKVLPFTKELEEKYGLKVRELNIGGGLGITYTEETPLSLREFMEPIMDKVDRFYGENRPTISVEPGRHMVGSAGYTLYTVGSVKRLSGRTFVAVDGGMGDNLRPALYDADYYCHLVKDSGEPEEVEVVGRYCESGDVLVKQAELMSPEPGDLLLMYSTGAYHFSMANNYNRVPIPPVVYVKDGGHKVWVRGQTLEDLTARDSTL